MLTVSELIAQRVRQRHKCDDAKLAIVVEGGGMRGVLSAAAAAVIKEFGLDDLADLFVGTSAGATNALALATGTLEELLHCYLDVFPSPEFISPSRLLRGRPAIDSDRVILELEQRLGLADRLAGIGTLPLAMIATDVDTARPHPLTGFATPDEVLDALRASGRLPVLAGPPAPFRGRRWLDGGITEPVPVSAAIALGATHAIVVATRPLGSAPAYGPFDRAIALYLQRVNPALAEAFRERPERYRSLFTHLTEGHVGLPTVTITPRPSDPIPSRLERDAGLLREAAAASADTARETLARLMS